MEQLKQMLLKDYPSHAYDKIRYRDTDRQGHINNAVFSQYLETGRVELLYDPKHPLYCDDCSFVIAHVEISYIDEIKWPGKIDIGTGLTGIGRSSIKIAQGLYQDNRLVAIAKTVVVQVNNQSKSSQALSDQSRQRLGKYMLDVSSS